MRKYIFAFLIICPGLVFTIACHRKNTEKIEKNTVLIEAGKTGNTVKINYLVDLGLDLNRELITHVKLGDRYDIIAIIQAISHAKKRQPETVITLAALLSSDDFAIRRESALALGAFGAGAQSIIPDILKIYSGEQSIKQADDTMYMQLFALLGKINARGELDLLIQDQLNDPKTRKTFICSMYPWDGNEETAKMLVSYASGFTNDERLCFLEAFGKSGNLGSRETWAVYRQLLKSDKFDEISKALDYMLKEDQVHLADNKIISILGDIGKKYPALSESTGVLSGRIQRSCLKNFVYNLLAKVGTSRRSILRQNGKPQAIDQETILNENGKKYHIVYDNLDLRLEEYESYISFNYTIKGSEFKNIMYNIGIGTSKPDVVSVIGTPRSTDDKSGLSVYEFDGEMRGPVILKIKFIHNLIAELNIAGSAE